MKSVMAMIESDILETLLTHWFICLSPYPQNLCFTVCQRLANFFFFFLVKILIVNNRVCFAGHVLALVTTKLTLWHENSPNNFIKCNPEGILSYERWGRDMHTFRERERGISSICQYQDITPLVLLKSKICTWNDREYEIRIHNHL